MYGCYGDRKSNLNEIYNIINKNHFDIDFEVLLYEKDKNGKIEKPHGTEMVKFKFNEFDNLVHDHVIVMSKWNFHIHGGMNVKS